MCSSIHGNGAIQKGSGAYMSFTINFCLDFQTISLIFSFVVVLIIIKWGIDEGIKERERGNDKE